MSSGPSIDPTAATHPFGGRPHPPAHAAYAAAVVASGAKMIAIAPASMLASPPQPISLSEDISPSAFAQFAERVEGIAPENATAPERHDHRVQEDVAEDCHT